MFLNRYKLEIKIKNKKNRKNYTILKIYKYIDFKIEYITKKLTNIK